LSELVAHPAFQGGIAPFVVALVVVLLLQPLRLSGMAVTAGFVTAMVLAIGGLQFTPLTALRKVLILGLAAPLAGILVDFAFKPTRLGALLLALAAGAATLWVFWPVLANKPPGEAWLRGGAVVGAAVLMVGSMPAGDAIRAGAGGLALGVGVGLAAIFGATLTYGIYGAAVGAAAGAFLLPQMITGRKGTAGATFCLPAALLAALVGGGAVLLAELQWYCLAILAFVPLAVRLPGPERAAAWVQAVIFSLYGFVVAAIACYLAWP
jgi:hypothetical protein